MYDREYTPDRISELKENEIFVFGSNLTGAHGGGAERLAYNRFGAVWGEGVGLHGQTYAIPTIQGGVETIKPYVDDFIRFAKEHSRLTFLVTRIGCGIAGFRDEEIVHSLRMPLMWRISTFRRNLWRAWCINLHGNDRKQVTFASIYHEDVYERKMNQKGRK